GHDRMRGAVEDHLVAVRPDVQPDRDLVAQRPGGEEQRRLLAEQLGDTVLQRVHRGVEETLLVADLGLGDRLAHPGRGARLRVGVEVDQRSCSRNSAILSTACAASSPWWRLPPPTRASACSMLFTVSTPKAHGTPVSSPTRAMPDAAWSHT